MTRLSLLCLICFVLVAGPVWSQDRAAAVAYAMLVASQAGGEGQQALRFTAEDASRMRSVLQDVAGYPAKNVSLLIDPDRARLSQALDGVQKVLRSHAARGEKTVFFFYYSGHARSNAINLGAEEFLLKDLRSRLERLSSTVTIVVLDACQTGAISGVKGVTPATDFSYNSVADLSSEGLVVMASSASSELSQESAALKGSYFTHHLAVALRGAADANVDGRVTLNEAYAYTYQRTLESTARTAVGRQHPTLETDLTGKGDLVVSQPGKASSRLEIPAALSGEILVTRKDTRVVMAEIRKVAGERYHVALLKGQYEAVVRIASNRAMLCEFSLAARGVHVLDLGGCEELVLENPATKGGDVPLHILATPRRTLRREFAMLEAQIGYFGSGSSPLTESFSKFSYDQLDSGARFGGKLGISLSPLPYLSFVVLFSNLDRRYSVQGIEGSEQSVGWASYRLGGGIRGNLPLHSGLIVPYIQFSGGWAFSQFAFEYDNSTGRGTEEERHDGFFVSGAFGMQLNPWRVFGFTLFEVEYVVARTMELGGFDDRHNPGGLVVTTGIRVGY